MKKVSLVVVVFLLCFSSMAYASTSDYPRKGNEINIDVVKEMRELMQQSKDKVVSLLESQEYDKIEELTESKRVKELSEKYPNEYAEFLNSLHSNKEVNTLSSRMITTTIELGASDREVIVLDSGLIIESISKSESLQNNPLNSCIYPQEVTNEKNLYGPHLISTMKLNTFFDYNMCGNGSVSYEKVTESMNTNFPMNHMGSSSSLVSSSSTEIKTFGEFLMGSGVFPGVILNTYTYHLETTIKNNGSVTHTAIQQ